MISVPLARSYRPSSLLVSYCVFHFCHVLLSHRFLSLPPPPFPSYSLLLALRPFLLLLLLLGRFYSPIFIFLSTRSFIRARSFPSHPPSPIYPFNLSVFLRLYDRTSIPPFFSLFFSVSRLAQPTNLSAFRVALYTCQVSRNCETTL